MLELIGLVVFVGIVMFLIGFAGGRALEADQHITSDRYYRMKSMGHND